MIQYGISPEEVERAQHYLSVDEEFQSTAGTDTEINDGAPTDRYSVRTTNPEPSVDDRIGAIYFQEAPFASVFPGCTASHIGGKWWLTAKHCVDGNMRDNGFVLQEDGQYAGIENIYVKEETADIALLKVGTGIKTPGAFALSSSRPTLGKKYTIQGFSGHGDTKHDFSSRSIAQALKFVDSVKTTRGDTYRDVTQMRTLDFPSCRGDSGGPAFTGNTIVGVNSTVRIVNAESRYDECTEIAHPANVAPHISWITSTKTAKNSSSLGERLRAFKGGSIARFAGRVVDIADNPAFGCGSSASSTC